MKKTLFPALAAALVLAACGTKTTGQAEVAAEAAAQQVVSSDIAYVQVEAALAQRDQLHAHPGQLADGPGVGRVVDEDADRKIGRASCRERV